MNKLIKLILVSILLMQPLLAANPLTEALSEVSNVGSIDNGDGSKSYFSGSASIRFDFAKPPEPLWSFTPPSIEAGCNGIDIKGMFMSLLGLDQLGDMVENAGTSLAWGIAVGIIYSLPGVANAFKFINAWAKKIQQLLAAACGAGIIIGEWMADKSGVNKTELAATINDWTSKLDPGEVLKLKQKGAKGLLEVLGLSDVLGLDKAPKEERSAAIVALMKGVFESDASALGAIINDFAQRAQSSGTATVFESTLGINMVANADSSAVQKINFTIQDKTGGGTLPANTISVGVPKFGAMSPNSTSLTGASQAKLNVFAYVLQFNYIGDLAVSLPSQKEMDAIYEIAKATESNATAKKKAREQYKKIDKKNLSALSLIGPGQALSQRQGGAQLGKFIWYGIDDTQYSDGSEKARSTSNAALKAPTGTIYVIRDGDSMSQTSYIPVLGKVENKEDVAFYNGTDKYTGTLMSSRCIVDHLVSDGNTSTCNGYTFPEVYKYVKIIKNSRNSRHFFLKGKLIQIMSVKMATALLGAIDESTSMIRSSTGSFTPSTSGGGALGTGSESRSISTKPTMKMIFKLKQRKSAILGGANTYLRKVLADGFAALPIIETIFFKQARVNRQRGLKSLQK